MRTRTRVAFAAAVCLTAAWNGDAEAQRNTARSCAGDDIVGWVGLEQLECNCTSSGARVRGRSGESETQWLFRSEPVVGTIAPGTPAAGVLRRGDVIVAVDGHLITTAEGGRRFSHPTPGRALALRIRRDGRELNVRLTPLGLCTTDPRLGPQTPRAPVVAATPRRPPPAGARPSRSPAPAATAVAPPAPPHALVPAGRLGFGYSCSSCGWERSGRDGDPRLFFGGPPQVYSVEPGSPADRAGLRRGDIITHVDDVAITSDGGARRFTDVEPQQTVRYTIRRGRSIEQVTLRAGDRITSTETVGPRELRERIEQISRMRDLDEARRALVALASQLAMPLTNAEVRPRAAIAGDANQIRYSGQVGDAEIEVRGAGSVITTILEPDRDIRIVTDQATIRIRVGGESNR